MHKFIVKHAMTLNWILFVIVIVAEPMPIKLFAIGMQLYVLAASLVETNEIRKEIKNKDHTGSN